MGAKNGRTGRPAKDPAGPSKMVGGRVSRTLADRFADFVKAYAKASRLKVNATVHLEAAIERYLDDEEPKLKLLTKDMTPKKP